VHSRRYPCVLDSSNWEANHQVLQLQQPCPASAAMRSADMLNAYKPGWRATMTAHSPAYKTP